MEVLQAGHIAPPTDHLDLGDRVAWHHRACVARVPKRESGGNGVFSLGELPRTWVAIVQEGGHPPYESDDLFNDSSFLTRMPIRRINKTIVVWPEEGEGVIVGMIRRGIGTSHSGYTSGYYEPEWEPGYFEPEEWHWLYEVKIYLQQRDTIYVPLWGVYV